MFVVRHKDFDLDINYMSWIVLPLDVVNADTLYYEAHRALQDAQEKMKKAEWHTVMRSSQICIELSVKGMLRLFDIEYRPEHDVSEKLGIIHKKVDGLSGYEVESIAGSAISCRIWEPVHSLAVYGIFNVSPSSLFRETDAKAIIESASNANSLLLSLLYKARMNQLKME